MSDVSATEWLLSKVPNAPIHLLMPLVGVLDEAVKALHHGTNAYHSTAALDYEHTRKRLQQYYPENRK